MANTPEGIKQLVIDNILSGGRRTTAEGVREVINETMDFLIDLRENGMIVKGADDLYRKIKIDGNGQWQVVAEIGPIYP